MPEKKLSVAPPEVTIDDLEEYLATDNLFIEYFNAFLKLPTFVEPLAFNKERGGFEVVTNAKQELKNQMQAAVRSKQSPNHIYKVTKQVLNEKNPPKVKYDDDSEEEEEPEIKTTFKVQCLNKEQGIQWIKEERMPAFLHSDIYLEYRLAKVVSQTEIATKEDKPIQLVIDSSYKPFMIEKPVVSKPVAVDTKSVAFRDMFICLGETQTTQTDDWYNDVKLVTDTNTTQSANSRPLSAQSRPTSARPPSALSKDLSMIDSGVWSLCRQESFSNPSQTFSFDGDASINSSKLFDNPPKLRPTSPKHWRAPIGDQSCVVLESEKRNYGGAVHLPVVKQNLSKTELEEVLSEGGESGVESEKADSETADNEGCIQTEDGKIENEMDVKVMKPIVVDNIDQLVKMTVTYSIKRALQCVTNCSDEVINAYLDENVLKSETVKSADLQEDTLNNIEIRSPSIESDHMLTVPKQIESASSTFSSMNSVKDSVEEDSLIDSDEEEDDNYTIFTRTKRYDLSNKKGIDAFKNFLCGNLGEKYWSLWLDLDRGNSILNTDNENQFICQLREKYVNSRGVCVLPQEVQRSLGFSESYKCSFLADLLKMQPKVLEPLLLYWAPKFLMREHYKCNPATNYLYRRQQLNRPVSVANPEPKAIALLPLRPKTCMPKLKRDVVPNAGSALHKEVSPATIKNSTFTNLSFAINLQGITPKPPTTRQKMNAETQQEELKEQPHENTKPTSRAASARSRPNSRASFSRPASAQPVTRSENKSKARAVRSSHTLQDDRHGNQVDNQLTNLNQQGISFTNTNQGTNQHTNQGTNQHTNQGTNQHTNQHTNQGTNQHTVLPNHDAATNHEEYQSLPLFPISPHSKNLVSFSLPGQSARPSSACSSRTSDVSSRASDESEFFGGRRIENLLQGLMFEKKSGGFFMTYLQQLGDKVLINCLHCWHDIQEYHTLFFSDTFSEYVLNRKAQAIFGKHVVPSGYYHIGCSKDIQGQVRREISPPFEELFDLTEEYILEKLAQPFSEMKQSDQRLYDKIQMTQEERRVETRESRYLRRLQRRTMFKEAGIHRISTPDIGPEDDATKQTAYYQSLWDKVPQEFKDYDFNKLIHNRLELEHFKQFLEENYAVTDLLCWMDIESFRRTSHIDNLRRDKKAKDIKIRYLNKKYFFGSNSPATRQQQHLVMQAGGGWGKILLDRPPTQILIEAQKYVQDRIQKKWLPMFLSTDGFYQRMKPLLKIDDVVDDLLLAKKQRSMAIYKLLEGKWVSSSREIIAFRHAMQNAVTCSQLRKFVSLRGDHLENDILFWLEVQKFKEMYHNHTEESLIHQKIQTILACFINSEMPPSLQIDITPEQAEKLLDKRMREFGPYAFREAQMTVFRVLYPHWNEFLKYKNTVAEEKLLYELEKKKKRQMRKEMEKKRIQQDKEFARKGYISEYEDDRTSNASATQTSKSLNEFFEDNFDDGIQKVEWKYSHYVSAIEDEQVRLNGDDRASSILSVLHSIADEESKHSTDSTVEKENDKNRQTKSRNKGDTRAQKYKDSIRTKRTSTASESIIKSTTEGSERSDKVKKQVRMQDRPISRVGSARQRSKLSH
ncbi:regulator of G-protein signaling 22-like [Antedon mediterranea]|uniref:regulator of G-protein signaling 22-like n=1 Tax=Antedon mediterranea TaxID=105859 RepID=UPI003AF7AAAC